MIKRKVKKYMLFFLVLLLFNFSAFSKNHIISPCEGTWGNYQALVIDVPEDTTVFYSFTGENPLVSGFAYDNPVFIEIEGNITLKVAFTKPDGTTFEESVRYSVKLENQDLLAEIQDKTNPVLIIGKDNPLRIPSTASFIFGESRSPYLEGCKVFSDSDNDLTEILPLIVKNENNVLYRFMVQTKEDSEKSYVPKKTGKIEQKTEPLFYFESKTETSPQGKEVQSGTKPSDEKTAVKDKKKEKKQKTSRTSKTSKGKSNAESDKTVSDGTTAKKTSENSSAAVLNDVNVQDSQVQPDVKPAAPVQTASQLSELSLSKVPFSIKFKDWTKVEIKTPDNVYCCLDNGYWQTGNFELLINRNTEHKLYWMNNDRGTDSFNPDICTIYYSVIPVKPKLICEQRTQNSGVKVRLDKKKYSFCLIKRRSYSQNLSQPKDSFYLDTVYGNEIDDTVEFLVMLDEVPQGVLTTYIKIDRLPPPCPVIECSENKFLLRDSVSLGFSSSDDVYTYSKQRYVHEKELSDIKKLKNAKEKFDFYFSSSELNPDKKLQLEAVDDFAVFYEVAAFAKDAAGNVSAPSYYSAVIDYSNFYFTQMSLPQIEELTKLSELDGSIEHPYADFNQIEKLLKLNRKINIHLTGNFENVNPLKITSNTDFISKNGSQISFNGKEFMDCTNCTVRFLNCVLTQKNEKSEGFEQVNFFNLKNSSLVARNCELISIIGTDGSMFVMDKSNLILEKCGVTLQSEEYGAIVNALNSNVNIIESRLAIVSDTAVGLSLNKGNCDMNYSSLQVDGRTSKFVEFYGVKYSMKKNRFLYKKQSNDMFFENPQCVRLLFEGNVSKLF